MKTKLSKRELNNKKRDTAQHKHRIRRPSNNIKTDREKEKRGKRLQRPSSTRVLQGDRANQNPRKRRINHRNMARTGRARKHTHPIPKVETNNTAARNAKQQLTRRKSTQRTRTQTRMRVRTRDTHVKKKKRHQHPIRGAN